MGISMRDMAAAQVKRSAVRAILGAIFTPVHRAIYLACGTLTIYTDGPRYSKSPGHRPRTSRQELQINAGAVLWAFVPSVARHFGAPTILVCALALVAVILIGRRLRYTDPQTQTRITVPAFWQRPALLIPMALGFAVALLPILTATRGGLLADLVPNTWWWLPGAAIGVGGACYWTALLSSARYAGRGRARASEVAAMLRVACGVTDAEVAEALRFKNGSWTLSPAPAIALAKLTSDGAGVDAAVASIMPRCEIVLDGRDLVIQEASLETADRRAQMAASEGLVIGQQRDEDILSMVLAAGTSPSSAERVQAYARSVLGADSALIVWEPYENRAVARVLSQDEQQVRARLAAVLKLRFAWELEADVISRDGHIDQVVLHRLPPGLGGVTPEERIEFWRSVARSLPSGSNGWTATEASDGVITLKWGPKRALRQIVPGREILPTSIDPSQWKRLTYGVTETGEKAVINLQAGPHSLIVGGSGSGKSYATRMVILSALARGFEYVAIDPSKKLAGLRDIDPYAKFVATESKAQASDTLSAVYAEVQRRVALTEQYRVEGWRQMPAELGIRPWLVVVDEYAALLEPDLMKPRDRKAAEYEDWEAEQTVLDNIESKMSRIAGEARSAGIHLCVITQTAHSNLFGARLRQNLGTIIQLVPPARPPQRNQLGMIFSPEETDAASETINALNDGRSPGFAVASIEGAGLQGLRVGLIINEPVNHEQGVLEAIRDDVEYLEELKVPLGIPLQMTTDSMGLTRPEDTFGQIIESTTPATDLDADLGEIDLGDLDLGDLDLGDIDLGELTTASPGELPPVPAAAPAPTMFDTPGDAVPAAQQQQPPVITDNKPNFDDLFG